MIHPLQQDLSTLKDAEIESTLQSLTKKYVYAQRLGQPELLTQLSTFITIYKEELAARYRKAVKNANLDGDLDQLINVD